MTFLLSSMLLNHFRFRSHLQSIAAFPFTLWWTHDRCDTNCGNVYNVFNK